MVPVTILIVFPVVGVVGFTVYRIVSKTVKVRVKMCSGYRKGIAPDTLTGLFGDPFSH